MRSWVFLMLVSAVPAVSAQTAQQSAPAPAAPSAQAAQAAQFAQIEKMQQQLADWAQLNRYRADNATLAPTAPGEPRVVFYGDSITDGWGRWNNGPFFPGKPYVNRGISGQTTPQMLVRFQQDVVHLGPAAVVVLAGTNDIAGNTGPSTPQMIEDNFRSMAAIAQQNGIKVVLASILPAGSYPWRPGVQPVATIREVNAWLKDFCAAQHFVYLDYYAAMADDKGAMKQGLASDGVHPTAAGYAVMAPLAEAAIAQALGNNPTARESVGAPSQ